jgi:hypothetical protein
MTGSRPPSYVDPRSNRRSTDGRWLVDSMNGAPSAHADGARHQELRRLGAVAEDLRARSTMSGRIAVVGLGLAVTAVSLPWMYDRSWGYERDWGDDPFAHPDGLRWIADLKAGGLALGCIVGAVLVVTVALVARRYVRPAAGIAAAAVGVAANVGSGISEYNDRQVGVAVAITAAAVFVLAAVYFTIDSDPTFRWTPPPTTPAEVVTLLPRRDGPLLVAASAVVSLVLSAAVVALAGAPWWVSVTGEPRVGVTMVGDTRILAVAAIIGGAALAVAIAGVRRALPAVAASATVTLATVAAVWSGWGNGPGGTGVLVPATIAAAGSVTGALVAVVAAVFAGGAPVRPRWLPLVAWPAAVALTPVLVIVVLGSFTPALGVDPPAREGAWEVLVGSTAREAQAGDPTAGTFAVTAAFVDGGLVVLEPERLVRDIHGRIHVLSDRTRHWTDSGPDILLGVAGGRIVIHHHVSDRPDSVRLIDPGTAAVIAVPVADDAEVAVGPDDRIWFDEDANAQNRAPGGLRSTTVPELIAWAKASGPHDHWPGDPPSPTLGLGQDIHMVTGGLVEQAATGITRPGDPGSTVIAAAAEHCGPSNDRLAFGSTEDLSTVPIALTATGDAWFTMTTRRSRFRHQTATYLVSGGTVRQVADVLIDERVTTMTLDPDGRPVLTTEEGRVVRLHDPATALVDLPAPSPECRRPDPKDAP